MTDNNDKKHNDTKAHVASGDENASSNSSRPKYRLLGESGLVEDDEGNVFSASETDDSEGGDVLSSSEISSRLFPAKPENDKMPDWAAIYDPRYCGPSREAYIEEMEHQYKSRQAGNSPSQVDNTKNGDGQSNDDFSNHVNIAKETSEQSKDDARAKCNKREDPDGRDAKEKESAPWVTTPWAIGTMGVATSSVGTESSEAASKGGKAASEDNQELKPKKRKHDPNNWFGLHLRTRDVVFYLIGVILLIAYFIFLIYILIKDIAKLF